MRMDCFLQKDYYYWTHFISSDTCWWLCSSPSCWPHSYSHWPGFYIGLRSRGWLGYGPCRDNTSCELASSLFQPLCVHCRSYMMYSIALVKVVPLSWVVIIGRKTRRGRRNDGHHHPLRECIHSHQWPCSQPSLIAHGVVCRTEVIPFNLSRKTFSNINCYLSGYDQSSWIAFNQLLP